MSRGAPLACCALALLLVACRDAAETFVSLDRPQIEIGMPRRLTFSARDDRAPSWNATSDTVIYSGYTEDLAPAAPATILALHRAGGGIAREVLSNAQVDTDAGRWLVVPSVHVELGLIAYVDLAPLRDSIPCQAPAQRCGDRTGEGNVNISFSPRLVSATVHARAIDAQHDLADDDTLRLELLGFEVDTVPVVPLYPTFRSRHYPFQQEYDHTADLPFRASWAPDGTRAVTSDGLSLIIWETATGAATPVPGTQDGMSAAWSPDGEWIAYTWVERLDSIGEICVNGVYLPFSDTIDPWCYERRTYWVTAPARVVLVRPDGSGREIVAEGRDPAWDAQGRLYFSSAAESRGPLRRFDRGSGEIVELAGTDGAREPAVSPDGGWIAYSWTTRRGVPRDVYVAELP